jgi:hypothetical protein
MMKKAILVLLGLSLLGSMAAAAEFRLGLKGSFFSSENATFRDVYGSAFKIGLEGGMPIAESFSVWAGLDYVHKTGALTLTQEETKVTLIPLSAGVRYEIPAGTNLRFHLGAGIQEVFFTEDSVLGTTHESALGFIAKAGGVYRLTDAVGAGVFVAWSTCKMTHESVDFKVGGIDFGGTVEIRF